MNISIAGIHTGIGKTVCSAVLVEALGYDYWKPVQAGNLDATDSMWVKQQISNPDCKIHPEGYRLKLAASPHWAAIQEGVEIKLRKLVLPESANSVVVETAGGVMSPLSKEILNVDLMKRLAFPVLLVSNSYLGSINHTLLSVNALKAAGIQNIGLIFCGEPSPQMAEFILEYTGLPLVLTVPPLDLNKGFVTKFAHSQVFSIKQKLHGLFG